MYRAKLQKSNDRTLALVKTSIDIVVAIGLLQLAPKTVTPRVTGALGFTTSLISCYQVKTLSSFSQTHFQVHIFHPIFAIKISHIFLCNYTATPCTSQGEDTLKQEEDGSLGPAE